MSFSTHRSAAWFLMLALLLVCAIVYIPGLHGDFVYDDWGSITGNPNIQVTHGTLSEWWRAALVFPSGTPPFRSLTMVSFAANYYLGGADAFGFKLTNLCIHLLNGVLLFLALRALFALRSACTPNLSESQTFNAELAAATIAGLWLLLPINLTAVLYAVQRLESFAATFIFLGLWWYISARLRLWRGRGGVVSVWLSLGVCTTLGLLCKETAVMLPLYAGLVEFCIARARTPNGKWSFAVVTLYVVTLLLPFVIGMIWMWEHYLGGARSDAFATSVSRMLSETRILVDYMRWTLIPSLDALTLYHDDITPSRGLFHPSTTFTSLVFLLALLALALWQRRQRPLFALGVLWFFAGHLLTATIVPLILAFEHRNYFSSAGLLLAVAAIVALEGPLKRAPLRVAAVATAVLFYAGTTLLRAQEWSDMLHLAMSDAAKRPRSPAAQFDYAAALLNESMKKQSSEAANAALRVLENGSRFPGASIHFEQSIITLLAESGYPAPDRIWTSLIDKLKTAAPDTNGVHALTRLNHCFISKQCSQNQLPELQHAYDAAFSHTPPGEGLLATHAEYAWHIANDRDRAEQDFREALRGQPSDIAAQMNLALVLIYQGKRDETSAMIKTMERHNYLGSLDAFIIPLQRTLESVAPGEVKAVPGVP
jgi:hypothetical protein